MKRGRPLRVAFVTASLDLGGSERQMTELALRLPRDRFEVEFVLLLNRGPLSATVEAAGVPVHVVRWTRRTSPFSHLRWSVDWLRFVLVVRAGRYDILDAWLFHAYAIATVTRPFTRVPVLVSGRRSLSDFKTGHGRDLRLADTLARRSADAIVANSEAVRDDVAAFEGIDPARIRVIHNGVKSAVPMPGSVRATIRRNWGFETMDVVVGCVANYKARKGLEAMLRATADLTRDEPRLRVVLVGEGPLRPTLEQMISDLHLSGIVRLHGHAADARDLYGALDVVALASETEGLPNVLLEAAAAGRPIVATAAGGTVDIVIDGQTGLLVPVGDHRALVGALRRIVGDRALRERFGHAAKLRAETVFGMDRFVAETATLYEELGKRRAR
jgi:Glycosyltransferase